MLYGIAALSFLILLYAALAEGLKRWSISMPLVFVAVGFVLNGLGGFSLTLKAEGIKELTEITLALLLFADASTLQLGQVGRDAGLPIFNNPQRPRAYPARAQRRKRPERRHCHAAGRVLHRPGRGRI